MSKRLPQWVKDKGFHSWSSYMDSIRQLKGKQRRKVSAKSRKRNPESIYDEAVKILESNLRAKIREIKRQGTVGMSTRNLKQIVSTKGLRIPPSAFDRAFSEAIKRVRRSVKGFEIYEANPRKRKRNPVAVYNPKSGKKLPVSQVEIRYKRTDGRYNGKYFRHPFASSVSLYGLSDGSIKIKSNSGKKLWGTVD
jgi:hypothetical protein